jgi:TRAP transporter TAXI family solute receptor
MHAALSLNLFRLLLLLTGAASAAAAWAQVPAQKPVNLALGSVSSSSGVYAFAVALSNSVRKYDPGINVTAVEGGGGFDHARLMKQGVLDWSISGSPAVAAAVRQGADNFKKEGPWEPIRLMFMRNVSVSRIYLRADVAKKDNIRSWADLAGKRFAPGIPGTRDMIRAIEANKLLGTGITMVPSSLDDSTRRLKEGGFAGMLKGSPHDRFDTGMLETHTGTPLTVIGFAKGEAEKLTAQDPLNTFVTTPAGGIRELPGIGPLLEMSSAVMVMSSSRMSQETGYRIMKAVARGWSEIGDAHPASKGWKPVEDAFAQTPDIKGVHFHAGVIQFAKENGISVPERLIPPEYKGAR